MQKQTLTYASPESIKLSKGEKLYNIWQRALAKVQGKTGIPQIGRLPTGEKGNYLLQTGGMSRGWDPD